MSEVAYLLSDGRIVKTWAAALESGLEFRLVYRNITE